MRARATGAHVAPVARGALGSRPVKTRLDRVVGLREQQEEETLAALGRAQRAEVDAGERLAEARERASADERRAGDAVLWALDDGARRRALQAVRFAEAAVEEALRAVAAAKARWTTAHQETEAARRGAERKRAEFRADEARKERKDADEVASQRHGRG